MTLENYIKELESLEKNIPSLVQKFVKENSNYFLGNVKQRFYQKGIDGSGNKIGNYAQSTIERKEKSSPRQRTSHVTLRDSGNWYRSLFVKYEKNELFMDSSMKDLTAKLIQGGGQYQNPPYGDAIMDFTDEEILVWSDKILEDLGEYLQKKFNTDVIIE